MTFVINRIADRAFFDIIQATVNVRLPVDTVFVWADFFFLEQSPVGVNGIVGAGSGEIVCICEVVPEKVQIRISKAVRINKNGFVGAIFSSSNLSK